MSSHPFLSDEWMNAAKAIRDEFVDKVTEPEMSMRMNLVIRRAPFTVEVIEAHIDTSEGRYAVDHGHLDSPHVTVTTDYATAHTLFVTQDRDAIMQAFLGGKVQIVGDMARLLAAQATEPDTHAVEIARRVREITSS
ncbi:MAG: SCP2 sterol-binding domain-containing protein [Actinomycetia bacterium]|nr:SCP2 sterol-binding domain-containing protein [Actinomycetes bacterium]